MPVLVVIPGIAAFTLQTNLPCPDGTTLMSLSEGAKPVCSPGDISPNYDLAYPTMMGLAPDGIRGLIFAALIAAIISSLGSMMNSIATIFTMDLYKPLNPKTSENKLVWIGRTAAFVAMVVAVFTARPLLGQAEQAFQFIQEFTGFFTPGIVVLFILGMFWKRTTAWGGLAAAIGSAVFSLLLKIYMPDMPFMDRVGVVFLLCMATAVLVSLVQGGKPQPNAVNHETVSFETSTRFNAAAAVITAILIGFYWMWW